MAKLKISDKQISMFDGSKKLKITKPLRLIELFGGIGAQSKALENLGVDFESWFYCDFDKYAVKSYNAIHGKNYDPTDITRLHASDLKIIETDKYDYLLTYSYPCQSISLAGKQEGMKKGSNTKSSLLWEVERLLDELSGFIPHRYSTPNDKIFSMGISTDYYHKTDTKKLPQYLLMENVPQVIGSRNAHDFADWVEFLERLGYQNYFKILNAKDYEIPQNRARCYMVSALGDYYYEFPKPIKLKLRLKDVLEDEVDEKYYLTKKQIKSMQNPIFESMGIDRTNNIDGVCNAITTMCGGNREPKILCNVNPSGNGMNGNVYDSNNLCPTLTTNKGEGIKITDETICINSKVNGKQPSLQDRIYDSDGISTAITTGFMPSIKVCEATKKGYAEAYVGDGIYINRPHQKRETVQKQMCQTIKAQPSDIGVVLDDLRSKNKRLISMLDKIDITKIQAIDMYNQTVSNEINTIKTTIDSSNMTAITQNLRIRKLTPLECWRLMGFSDDDFNKAKSTGMSNAQLYKQAGNSIVVNVLMAIFKEML